MVEGVRYIARCSYGNDSIAMLQLMHEHGLKDVTVVYSDTGWATDAWMERVRQGEEWGRSFGWESVRLSSIGFEQSVLGHTDAGMTTPMPDDIADIVKGLTEAQRRYILDAEEQTDGNVVIYAVPPHGLNAHLTEMWSLAFDRLTPLGLRVRAALQEDRPC